MDTIYITQHEKQYIPSSLREEVLESTKGFSPLKGGFSYGGMRVIAKTAERRTWCSRPRLRLGRISMSETNIEYELSKIITSEYSFIDDKEIESIAYFLIKEIDHYPVFNSDIQSVIKILRIVHNFGRSRGIYEDASQ